MNELSICSLLNLGNTRGGVCGLILEDVGGVGMQSRGVHNHSLKRFCTHLEKYKEVQICPMQEDRNREDSTFFGSFD